MKNSRFMVDAMFTLEMSIVFPIVFMTLIGNILFSYYMHDRAKMQACAYSALLESSYKDESPDSVADEEKKKMLNFFITGITADCKSDEISYTGNVKSTGFLFDLFGEDKVTESKRFLPKMKKKYMYVFKVSKELIEEQAGR